VPLVIKADPVWTLTAYRYALLLSDLGWLDVGHLAQDGRTGALAAQLYRAMGSIGANIAEGYSRRTGKDRAHFYEFALGSARESREWCYRGRHVVGDAVIEHRLALLEQIIRLLLTVVPQQRESGTIAEHAAQYDSSRPAAETTVDLCNQQISWADDLPVPAL
jgi:four helix bundle protein